MKYLILIFFPLFNLWALAPIESLVLGDFSDQYTEKKRDPLNYLFTSKDENHDDKIGKISFYRAQIEEGRRLDYQCSKSAKVVYASTWQKTQVMRSMIATLQYVGLDIVTRALAKYAKHFEFQTTEYGNLVDNLIGNYCSKNISIISLKQLKKVMSVKFNKENGFQLPSVENNPFFSDALKSVNAKDDAITHEMFYTVNLFKLLCSWGSESENTRLLAPLLKNPQLMAFIIRQMSGERLIAKGAKVSIAKNGEAISVYCDNLICRKKERSTFEEDFPRAIGSDSLRQDLELMYCEEFRDSDYRYKNQVPKIKKMINEMSFEDENFSVGQMMALISGVPDFFLRAKNFSDWKRILRSSVDENFDKWSKARSNQFSSDVFFEESLSIEKVDRKLFFNKYTPNFMVQFDVNLGEFDRGTQIAGKISVKFDIELPLTYLAWVRDKWINWDPRNHDEKKIIQENFKKYITDSVRKAREKFKIPPWRGDLERLIVKEILGQLNDFKGDAFEQIDKKIVTVPVILNFSPFAMKYIRYKYNVIRNAESAAKNYQ